MNVKSEEIINFVNKFAECAFRDHFPVRACDATIGKIVRQNVDQIELNPKRLRLDDERLYYVSEYSYKRIRVNNVQNVQNERKMHPKC